MRLLLENQKLKMKLVKNKWLTIDASYIYLLFDQREIKTPTRKIVELDSQLPRPRYFPLFIFGKNG